MQQIIITGNLGRDPEMRYLQSGQAVTSFSVATNRTWTDRNGEQHKETDWFRVSAWGNQAENCNKYLVKGSKVLVIGRITSDPKTGGPRIWKGDDGEARSSHEVNASHVEFLSSKGDAGDMVDAAVDAGGQERPPEDDIPF